jgi:hypothetical protein
MYNEYIKSVRSNILNTTLKGDENNGFKLDRVSEDIAGLNNQLEEEAYESRRMRGIVHAETDFDHFNDQHIEAHMATFKIVKEDEEEFEDAWQGLTSDIFINMRDDLRSQYD